LRRCQPRPKPAVGLMVLVAFCVLGCLATMSVILTSLLGNLLISTGVPASRAVHREQRVARVSESADTDEPQKKHSIWTFTLDFLRTILVLDTRNLHKSYILNIYWRLSIVNTPFNLGIYYIVLISKELCTTSQPCATPNLRFTNIHWGNEYHLFVFTRGFDKLLFELFPAVPFHRRRFMCG
jgi:hypothetical protein